MLSIFQLLANKNSCFLEHLRWLLLVCGMSRNKCGDHYKRGRTKRTFVDQRRSHSLCMAVHKTCVVCLTTIVGITIREHKLKELSGSTKVPRFVYNRPHKVCGMSHNKCGAYHQRGRTKRTFVDQRRSHSLCMTVHTTCVVCPTTNMGITIREHGLQGLASFNEARTICV